MEEFKRFANLGFEDFKKLAQDQSLSKYQRIGFPDSYRQGKEQAIFNDILSKLPAFKEKHKTVLDIGPGCSDLPALIIQHCIQHHHQLILVDSKEMLDQLEIPVKAPVEKCNAFFPNCTELLNRYSGKVDIIICYSVLHYAFVDTSIFRFVDAALSLLAPGGALLLGDIPNVSKRKRFFASSSGIAFHQQFMKTNEVPEVHFNRIEPDLIDDAVVLSIVQRARLQGFDAYVLPQDPSLPMANRREDVLIIAP